MLVVREFKQQQRRRLRKRYLKSDVALLQTLSRFFHLVQFVKSWPFFWELNSKRLYQSSEKDEESRYLLFTSFTKGEITRFHVVVVQWRERNVQISVMHEYCCCFDNLDLLLLCRSRWRRRRRCLSSPSTSLMPRAHAKAVFLPNLSLEREPLG